MVQGDGTTGGGSLNGRQACIYAVAVSDPAAQVKPDIISDWLSLGVYLQTNYGL